MTPQRGHISTLKCPNCNAIWPFIIAGDCPTKEVTCHTCKQQFAYDNGEYVMVGKRERKAQHSDKETNG